MRYKLNSILASYLLDYDVEIEHLKDDFQKHVPKKFVKLCKQIKETDGIYSWKKLNNFSQVQNKTNYECDVNDFFFSAKDLGLKKANPKRYLTAYVASAFYLARYLKDTFRGEFTIYFVFFISKEITHDIRFNLKRGDESWLPENFYEQPLSSGVLRIGVWFVKRRDFF